MIDILVPTYNRAKDLEKNLTHLDNLIKKENVDQHFRILISNNASTDNTLEVLEKVKKRIGVEIVIYNQNNNIGLEKNAIFLLEKATSGYVMYIGDDDYLPEKYLSLLIELIGKDENLTSIIPGTVALYSDGTLIPGRLESFSEKKYLKGFSTAYEISYLGHQLSGVVQKRNGLYEEYTKKQSLRNIYPFIFFLGYNSLQGNVYYVPSYKIKISVSNSKDWAYDDSGLLTEIFKNYKMLYPKSPLKRLMLCFSVMSKQKWRLRVGKNLKLAIKSFNHLVQSSDVDSLVKLTLPFIYLYLYIKGFFGVLKRKYINAE
jgi:glycosyltransferase involved in cell wall biosynthesis